MTELHVLRTTIPWFGNHTGYERLSDYMDSADIISPGRGLVPRLKGKWISLTRGYGVAPQAHVAALRQLEQKLLSNPSSVGHILYGEDFVRFTPRMPKEALKRIVFTFHQPPGQWRPELLEAMRCVENAVVLYSKDIAFFSHHLARAPQLILHGVDTEFFSPSSTPPQRRILFAGVHLRNLTMLRKVVEGLTRHHADLGFDFLVPVHRRENSEFKALSGHIDIRWHAGLSDQALVELYRQSWLMLLPMEDSGANTAVVEALACGLPVATTDVGGIRDYGGGTVFPVVPNNDIQGMIDLVEEYLSIESRNVISTASRTFAEDRLAWPTIASQHALHYQSVRA